jgi:peptidoglycan-N-acetylglucosamine deacetylase
MAGFPDMVDGYPLEGHPRSGRPAGPGSRRVSTVGPRTGADALVPAQPVLWPEGRTSAGSLTFDLDAEAVVLTTDPAARHRMSPMSHQSYGPLIGVPRILGILERHAVRATFFVPGYSADRYPGVVRSIAAAGHEIAHHSYLHENTVGMDEKTEAAMLDLGLAALEEAAGVRPTGYRAPMWELNYHTPRLLAERGFRYDSSLMDAEYPYRLAVDPDSTDAEARADGGSLVELPVSWALDDWEQYAFLPGLMGMGLIESPTKALEMWSWELGAIQRLGGLFNLCSHPFLTGRPSRAEALDVLLQRMLEPGDMWVTSLDEIAEHIAGLDLVPRRLPQPAIPEEASWAARDDATDPGSTKKSRKKKKDGQ